MRPAWVGSMEAALKSYPMPEGFALVDTDQILHFGQVIDEDGEFDVGWIAYIAETRPTGDARVVPIRLYMGITGGEVRAMIEDALERLRKDREKRDAEEADATRTRNP